MLNLTGMFTIPQIKSPFPFHWLMIIFATWGARGGTEGHAGNGGRDDRKKSHPLLFWDQLDVQFNPELCG